MAELAQEEILEPGRKIHVVDVSDTETCGEVDQPSKRLRLVWRQTQVDSCLGPDSHDQRVARVRRAMHREVRDRVVHATTEFLILAVDRVGHVDPGGEIPREVRHLQWSTFNVPLMWAANDQDCAILEWLNQQTESLPPVLVNGVEVATQEVLRVGWTSFATPCGHGASGHGKILRDFGGALISAHGPRKEF